MSHTLSFIRSQDHADAMAQGCAWHGDPDCLCDVDRSKFIVGDGPYNVPPDMVRRWTLALEADEHNDDWFHQSWGQAWWDTIQRELTCPVADIALAIEEHPEAVDALVAGVDISTVRENMLGGRYGLASDLARLVGAAPQGKRGLGLRRALARHEAVRMYEQDGLNPVQIREALEERGCALTQTRVTQWLSRYSQTYQEHKAERAAKRAARRAKGAA